MKILLIPIFLLFVYFSKGQQFGASDGCNINVNNSQTFRDIAKRASFKIRFVGPAAGNCTGTLINRDIEQNQLGNFFLIAKHCINGIDVTRMHEFYFNYQAPNPNDNNSTVLSNRGISLNQSNTTSTTSLGVGSVIDGYHYFHASAIRIVSANFWGDFALCEILTPIPPHFNVAYAGWNPSIGTFVPVPFVTENYFMPHHPKGDIKKMSATSTALSAPGDLGCRLTTKVVDFLFGWIWGRRWSTEVICKYSEVPWAYVPNWNIGHDQEGSSGSGLFNGNNRLLGVLSGSLSNCNIITETENVTFGKFRSNYYVQSTKNTLNPENKFWIDQFGIEGRTITCYQNLNNLSGQYFAANAYQANNKITLQSSTTVSTNGTLRIHPGADYSFVAGQSITLNPGFEIVPPQAGETMGVFEAKISSCVVPRSDESRKDIPAGIVQRAKNLQLPQYKPFNPHLYLNKDNGLLDLDSQSEIQTYPNPSSDGNFTVRFIVDSKKAVNLSFTDLLGKTLFSSKYNCIQGENYFPLDLSEKGLSAGIYFVILDDGNSRRVKKVVIK